MIILVCIFVIIFISKIIFIKRKKRANELLDDNYEYSPNLDNQNKNKIKDDNENILNNSFETN